MGRIGTDGDGSQNRLPGVPKCLDNRGGVGTMKEYRLKVEIAQLSLSDLGRRFYALRIPSAL